MSIFIFYLIHIQFQFRQTLSRIGLILTYNNRIQWNLFFYSNGICSFTAKSSEIEIPKLSAIHVIVDS